MASEGLLEGPHIVGIASKIHINTMENIASAKFKLEAATIKNIKADNKDESEKQSQEMIRRWKNRLATGVNQIEVRDINQVCEFNVCIIQ